MVKLECAMVAYGTMKDFTQVGDYFVLQNDMKVYMRIIINPDSHIPETKRFELLFKRGFKCDGLSVPFALRWFLPKWDKNNRMYNLAGVVHDALYANKGFCVFTREECDDIFRGIMRESGISRFKAGCADKAVEWAASSHFGDDSYNVKHLVKLG